MPKPVRYANTEYGLFKRSAWKPPVLCTIWMSKDYEYFAAFHTDKKMIEYHEFAGRHQLMGVFEVTDTPDVMAKKADYFI